MNQLLRFSKPYLFAIKIVWESSRKWTVFRFILMFFQAFLPLLGVYFLKLLIDGFVNGDVSLGDSLSDSYFNLVAFALSLMGGAVAQLFGQYVAEAQQQKTADFLAKKVQDHTLTLDLSFYENPENQNIYFQAQREVVYRPVMLVSSLMNVLLNGLSILMIAGYLMTLHYSIALILVVSILPSAVIRQFYSKKLFDWKNKRIVLERESFYLNNVLVSEDNAKEVRIFGADYGLQRRFESIRAQLFGEKLKIEWLKARNSVFAKIIEILVEVGLYAFVIYRASLGAISVGDLVVYIQVFQRGKNSLTLAMQNFVQLIENRLFLQHISDFLTIKPSLKSVTQTSAVDFDALDSIALVDVSFKYPKSDVFALRNVNLSFHKGGITAIVGENGSGKTTLMKLLCRFYDPSQGYILLNSQNLIGLDLKQYRAGITATFQDFSKFHLDVKSNIAFGETLDEMDFERIKKAARRSGADDFIGKFESSYDQKLGKFLFAGNELSLGQWQKMALARAFYHQSPIVIMDEPTSAIDPLAEHEIFDYLQQIAKDRFVILITHRLYNLSHAEKIVVMHQGQVAEEGKHADLLHEKGRYFEMFNKQRPQIN